MSNNGLHVVKVQNDESHIRMLAAQSNLYSLAKNLFFIQCFIVGPIAILFALMPIVFKEMSKQFTWILGLYSISAVVMELILETFVTKLKQKAASIQELFDQKTLGIPWNSTLIHHKPDLEIIYKHYKLYLKKNNIDGFYNWYSKELIDIKTNLAVVISQRTNCTYDFSLRNKYTKAVKIIAITVFIILFIVSASSGVSLRDFIVQVLAPSAPVFILAWKQISANNESIENLKSLKNQIEDLIASSNMHSIIGENTIRQIQDKIYYNRILSPLIPDWLFTKNKFALESSMDEVVREIVKELQSR